MSNLLEMDTVKVTFQTFQSFFTKQANRLGSGFDTVVENIDFGVIPLIQKIWHYLFIWADCFREPLIKIGLKSWATPMLILCLFGIMAIDFVASIYYFYISTQQYPVHGSQGPWTVVLTSLLSAFYLLYIIPKIIFSRWYNLYNVNLLECRRRMAEIDFNTTATVVLFVFVTVMLPQQDGLNPHLYTGSIAQMLFYATNGILFVAAFVNLGVLVQNFSTYGIEDEPIILTTNVKDSNKPRKNYSVV